MCGLLYHHIKPPGCFPHRDEGLSLLHSVSQKPWGILVTVPIAHNFIYKCQILGNTVRRAERRWARRCIPLLQGLLPATLTVAYRNPWGTRRTILHPAQISCSSPITTPGARRARSATPASPCPPAQWYRRWHLCPGAGVGSICTSCSQGRTSPSFRAGDTDRMRTAVSATDSAVQSNGSLRKASGKWALAGTYERLCRCLRKAF